MPTIAQELAKAPVLLLDDPEGARHVVGLQMRAGVDNPGDTLLAVHRNLRHLAGDYGPRSVDLPVPAAGVHAWEQAFGAKVRPCRPVALLRLPAGVLSGQVGGVRRSTLAWQVRDSLTERLGAPTATLTDIAASLAADPRTVQRALSTEGLTFASILDCVRRERAFALLTETDLPVGVVSARLGFAEAAVLVRCARRWWGMTPSRLRASADIPS